MVSSLPYRRQRDGVYEVELPLTMPTGFYFGGYGPKGLAGAGQSAYRDAVSGGEGVLLSGGMGERSTGGFFSLDWRRHGPGYLAVAFP